MGKTREQLASPQARGSGTAGGPSRGGVRDLREKTRRPPKGWNCDREGGGKEEVGHLSFEEVKSEIPYVEQRGNVGQQ